MATEPTEPTKQPPPKYPADRARDVVKQCRFATRPGRLEVLKDAAVDLLAALRTAIGSGVTEGPDGLSFTWKLDDAVLAVAIRPAAEITEVVVEAGQDAAARSATVALDYNANKARFESAQQTEPMEPGKWPEKRNALEVVLEGCLRVLSSRPGG